MERNWKKYLIVNAQMYAKLQKQPESAPQHSILLFKRILMYLFGKNSLSDVDNLLTSFYQLDDEARKEVVEMIQFKLQYHRDTERAEQIKQIKGW